jgi:hypothetical protein
MAGLLRLPAGNAGICALQHNPMFVAMQHAVLEWISLIHVE